MNLNKKMMWPALAASLVAVTSMLSAADDMRMRNLDNRISALEQRTGGGGVNPSARIEVNDGCGLFITGEALYWKATQNGLQFTVENTVDGSTLTSPLVNDIIGAIGIPSAAVEVGTNFVDADIETVKPKYNWGFRVGLGYNLPRDCWDLYLVWTNLHSNAHHNEPDRDDCSPCEPCCVVETSEQYPTWSDGASAIIGPLDEAKARWSNQLNVLDLELGRDFYVSKWLSLRPHFGLRGDIIHTNYRVEYENDDADDFFSLFPKTDVVVKHKTRWWGVGLRAGLNTDWDLCWGVSLYGNWAISLLYGRFTVTREDFFDPIHLTIPAVAISGIPSGVILTDSDDPFDTFSFRKRFWDEVATTDLQLGFRWDTMFCDDSFHLGINVGWEHHLFFHMNQFIEANHFDFQNIVMTSDNGDLGYQGWTFGFRFDF